jgi:hypothetical protein
MRQKSVLWDSIPGEEKQNYGRTPDCLVRDLLGFRVIANTYPSYLYLCVRESQVELVGL